MVKYIGSFDTILCGILLRFITIFSFIGAQEMFFYGYVYSSIAANGEINPISNAQVAIGMKSVPEGTLTYTDEEGYYELMFDWSWDGAIPIICNAANYEFYISTLMPTSSQVEFNIQLNPICDEPNPAGCVQTGCPEGFQCIDDWENNCVSFDCDCTPSGQWVCDDDCNGGTCIPMQTLGDLNNDTEVNVLDIVLIISFILMTNEPTDAEFSSGDINSDEQLNVLDVVAIVQMILNLQELPEDCFIEPEIGPCDGFCPTYYFNHNTNECEEYITGCCGVEAFNTMGACQSVCE